MKAFKELDAHGLHWVQSNGWTSFTPTYQLCDADDNPVATLRRLHWWNHKVEVDAPGNRWLLERKGLFRQHIEITSVGTGDSPALYHYKGWNGGGTLTLHDGRVYHWRSGNFWGNKWGWLDADEQPVLAFDASGFFKAQAEVRFDDDADFPSLLLFLGWYLYTLYVADRAAAGAT